VMAKNPFDRGKSSIRVNLKNEAGLAIVRRMLEKSDVLIESYRPGVMESLGLGPDQVRASNPGLIYGRLTGWGQEGAYGGMAGHDINYIALSGALSLFRRKGERPLPPCNVLGDFCGGGMLCAMGILLALIERTRSGKGQVIDAAMVDGAALLCTYIYGLVGNRMMSLDIGTNMLDGGAPYYQAYETRDGKFMAVGAVEGRFYSILLEGLGIDPASLPPQNDKQEWPEIRERFAEIFLTRTRDEWTAVFDGKDACVVPVLGLDEVHRSPHNKGRNLLMELDGVIQPAPAPRLSRTPGRADRPGRPRGAETRAILGEAGYTKREIEELLKKNVVEQTV
jgi:alpha-methylacyl-CoA racemase